MIGLRFLLLGIWGIVLSAISSSGAVADPSPPLFGPNGSSFWTLVSFTDGPQDPDAIFIFEGEVFSLDVPCFRRPWGYRHDGAFTPIPLEGNYTDRCPGVTSPSIVAFDAMMPKVKLLQLDGDRLSLADADNRTLLVLQRLRSTGIENRAWRISEFFDGISLVTTRERLSHPQWAQITFVHGGVDGSPGCGALSGRYSLDRSRITIEAGWLLAGYCPPGDMETNHLVLTALNGERVLKQEGDRLILLDSQDRIQVVLTPWRDGQP